MTPAQIIDGFHAYYYDLAKSGGTWERTTWLGVKCYKMPQDLFVYQEIINERRPDLIVETGTFRGGTALFLAGMCELVGHGKVITIDIKDWDGQPRHRRLDYWRGRSSTDPEVVARVERKSRGKSLMVVLDADHSKGHVLREMELYAPLVGARQYLIVEDGNINGHPVYPDFGPGPWEAIDEFLPRHPEFTSDRSREYLLVTQNPKGFLQKSG